MDSPRTQNPQAALTSLEAAAASTRGGFGCMFSTSEEFELALITERRAQGRYDQPVHISFNQFPKLTVGREARP